MQLKNRSIEIFNHRYPASFYFVSVLFFLSDPSTGFNYVTLFPSRAYAASVLATSVQPLSLEKPPFPNQVNIAPLLPFQKVLFHPQSHTPTFSLSSGHTQKYYPNFASTAQQATRWHSL